MCSCRVRKALKSWCFSHQVSRSSWLCHSKEKFLCYLSVVWLIWALCICFHNPQNKLSEYETTEIHIYEENFKWKSTYIVHFCNKISKFTADALCVKLTKTHKWNSNWSCYQVPNSSRVSWRFCFITKKIERMCRNMFIRLSAHQKVGGGRISKLFTDKSPHLADENRSTIWTATCNMSLDVRPFYKLKLEFVCVQQSFQICNCNEKHSNVKVQEKCTSNLVWFDCIKYNVSSHVCAHELFSWGKWPKHYVGYSMVRLRICQWCWGNVSYYSMSHFWWTIASLQNSPCPNANRNTNKSKLSEYKVRK